MASKRQYMGGYSDNEISLDQWKNHEANGWVFLPAAGYRNHGSSYYPGVTPIVTYKSMFSCYWTSSHDSDNNENANILFFNYNNSNNLGQVQVGFIDRYSGCAVRLVRDLQ